MNMGVQISLQDHDFSSFRNIPRSGTTGSYYSSISNFFRNVHTVFCSGCTNLHSHQQCTSVPFSPPPHQHLLFLVFLIITILLAWGDNSLWFGFAFPWWLVMLITFSYTCCPFEYLLWKKKMSTPVLCPFFNWMIWFFAIELHIF